VVEEIIGRLPELSGAQLGRLEDEIRRERQLRASSEGGGEDAPGIQEGTVPPVTEVLEYRPHEDSYLHRHCCGSDRRDRLFRGTYSRVLRKVSDKEHEQRSDCVCSWYTKGEIIRKTPLWLPAGLGCMRL
jgi:hypothetical protein